MTTNVSDIAVAGLLISSENNMSVDAVDDAMAVDVAEASFATVTNRSLLWPELNLSQLFSGHQCSTWEPINHIYFQIANVFLLLSFLAPYGLWGLLYLRATLVIACSFYSLWSWTVTCYLDAAAWNAIFVLLNFLWALGTAWRLRPVSLSRDMNIVYTQLFQPLKVSRRQFQSVLSKTRQIRKVSAQETIIHEKVSRVDSLSLVLQGRLVVSQGGKALHIVAQHQFLDSPEWFGVTTDEYFQAQQSDESGPSGNGPVAVSGDGHHDDQDDWDDEKPMLIKTKELGLVTTVLGGDSACWRLGKINETENETVV